MRLTRTDHLTLRDLTLRALRIARKSGLLGWLASTGLMLLLVVPGSLLAVQTVGNGVYEVHVQSKQPAVNPPQPPDTRQFGSWNAVTRPGHLAGGDLDILFSGMRTTTNFSSLRVWEPNGTGFVDYTFGGAGSNDSPRNLDDSLVFEGPSPLVAPGRGWRTEWLVRPENLRIVQDVLVVGNSIADSAIYHTVQVENVGVDPARIGWRNLYDWQLTGASRETADQPFNRFERTCGRPLQEATTEEFLHAPVTADLVRVFLEDGGYEPLLALRFDPGYRADLPVTTPDEYAYVEWEDAKARAFDYTPGSAGLFDDSAGLSWFGRKANRARRVPPEGSVRFTQVLFAVEPGECPASCLTTTNERTLCTADGSGDYLLRFRVQNNSGSPVSHLFVIDLPQPIIAEPTYLTFDDEPEGFLPDGHTSREKEIRIRNGFPGDILSFRFSLHDTSFQECCATVHTVLLPVCGCAQVVRGGFGCTVIEGTPVFSYKFVLQNLETTEVEYILAAPQSGGITVLQNPRLSRPLELGDDTKHLIRFFGPGAPLGGEACFRFSTHDFLFSECCSIQECVDLPTRCHDPGINLNTGYEQRDSLVLPGGVSDDDWRVVETGEPARVVRNPVSAWPNPFGSSAWISVDADRGRSLPGLRFTQYERCFCLAGNGGDVELGLSLFADDRARVFMNNHELAGPGGSFRGGSRLFVERTGTVGDGLFLAGQNCIQVEVENLPRFRRVTGLLLGGTVLAEDGVCPQ